MDCTGLSVFFVLVTTSLAFPSEHTFKRLPKMVVFDSDFTLWPFWVENSVNGPYHQNSTGQIVDSSGQLITYFPEVPKVFQYLKDHKILIAIFSPCFNVESTKTIINLFKWKGQFNTAILYPYGEYIPFDKLEEKSKISLEDMLFFDDQIFHYQDIMKNTKIALQQVKEGTTMQILMDDFTLWPFWVEHSVYGPYHYNSHGQLVDSTGFKITYYPEVPKVFQYLKDHKILIGMFTPSFNVESTKEMINLFKWKDQFNTTVFYSYGDYLPFDKLKAKSKIAFEDMLFFDDQILDYREMKSSKLAVVEVPDGMWLQDLMDGLKVFSDMKTSKV